MLTIAMSAVIQADPAAVWRAWRPSFPMRPPAEEARNLNLYDLAYGLRIPVTLVAGRSVRVGARYDVYGPMSIVYRLLLARGIRRSIDASFKTLERAANEAC